MPNIVTRGQWGARPPTSVKDIATPTPELWLHHTVSGDGGAARIRAIQDFHMDSRGWSDIAYSYLINMNGAIYEGRGLGRAGAHTKHHNSKSHGIAILGNYNNDEPTAASLASLDWLIRWGHNLGAWPAQLTAKEHGHGSAWVGTLTGGHRDTRGGFTNDCPGNKLYALIPEINRRLEREEMTELQARLEVAAGVYARTGKYMTAAGGQDPQERLTRIAREVASGQRTVADVLQHFGIPVQQEPGGTLPNWVLSPFVPFSEDSADHTHRATITLS